MEWLYDKNGRAQIFQYNDRFISSQGNNLAWIYNGNVYHLKSGNHIGWYEKGVLYDQDNKPLAFIRNCEGHLPYRPALGAIPASPAMPAIPARPGFSGIPGRPGYGNWSSKEILKFFE